MGKLLCDALGAEQGSRPELKVAFSRKLHSGYSRTAARVTAVIDSGGRGLSGSFALKLIRGGERRLPIERAQEEVDRSRALAKEPLFQKHFAPSLGVVPVPVSDEMRSAMVKEHGLPNAAIPKVAYFQLDRWIEGVPLENAVIGYLSRKSYSALHDPETQSVLTEFGAKVLGRITLCWERLKYRGKGVLSDPGVGDIMLTTPPGTGRLSHRELLEKGEPVFLDADADLRSGGIRQLKSERAEFIETLVTAICSCPRADCDPVPYAEFSDRVIGPLAARKLI